MVMLAALTFSFVQIQVVASEEYALVAQENRLRSIMTRAPRGTLFDRHGQVVAENVVAYQVLLMPAPRDSILAELDRLRPVLGLTDGQIERVMRRYEREPHLPLEVLRDAPLGAVARLKERRFLFPGVLVHEYPKRRYPAGEAVGHFVGYVAEISREELERPEFRGYRQGRWIGKAGLERHYERELGGEPGVRYLEVDARGRILQWLPEEAGVPPIPGRDLQLHLDVDLQRYMMEIFPQGRRGGFVAVDPRTGGVLALYSTPGYDPNLLVGGVDAETWAQLAEDPAIPLLDRSVGAAQPPGSTFKLATAVLGLRTGAIASPEQPMPIPCTGGLSYGGRYARCWLAGGHGRQNLIQAMQNSCNVYFYQVGIRVGLQRFVEEGSRIGFGGRTGIDLPHEIASIFPDGIDWWQRRWGYRPAANEIMSPSIGQGAVTLTPLKLAQLYVPVARWDGTAPELRLVMNNEPAPIALDYGLTREQIHALSTGLRRVMAPGGTGAMSRIPHWDIMGKTGTAQNPHGLNHGVFVGIGGPPGGEPEILVAILVAHGEAGSRVAPYAMNAINFYLNRTHGRAFERFPTIRERLDRGLPVDWAWFSAPVQDPPLPPPAGDED
jgi:penicillin-binding protein 2